MLRTWISLHPSGLSAIPCHGVSLTGRRLYTPRLALVLSVPPWCQNQPSPSRRALGASSHLTLHFLSLSRPHRSLPHDVSRMHLPPYSKSCHHGFSVWTLTALYWVAWPLLVTLHFLRPCLPLFQIFPRPPLTVQVDGEISRSGPVKALRDPDSCPLRVP